MKGVDNAAKDIEIRRLQRRIKRFEESGSSSSSGGGGGGGGTAADDKAIKDLQKKLVSEGKAAAKKYRDLEIKTKKEYKSLEAKASKDAKALSKANDELLPVRAERDQLKKRVTDLMNLGVEVASLREVAAKAPELEKQLQEAKIELENTMASLKKERPCSGRSTKTP